jgi:hypothetical protein
MSPMDLQRDTIETCAKATAAAFLRLAQNDARGARYLMEALCGNGIRTSSEDTPEARCFRELVAQDLATWEFIMKEAQRQKREELV